MSWCGVLLHGVAWHGLLWCGLILSPQVVGDMLFAVDGEVLEGKTPEEGNQLVATVKCI